MSPTLLEGFIVIVLLIVAWQIGVQIAPSLFGGLKQAKDQLNESSKEVEKIIDSEKEQVNDNQ